MRDFVYQNSTKVYFGKSKFDNLPTEIRKYGSSVLLVYGGGSIKRGGLYDKITDILMQNDITWKELPGVEPNPRHTTANKGVKICKENNIDVVLAVGGGSTIDCAKAIAAGVANGVDDVWELVKAGKPIAKALPLIAVLTNAATGSEMDTWAVISNMETNEKLSIGGVGILPEAAFENPEDTYTLPTYQTACGAFDIFNHVLDNYYLAGKHTFNLILEMQEAVMRTVVKYTPIAMADPENYEARANLMWASSLALNDILNAGTAHGCACHNMEHELSAYYDITHGHGLAIITPRWLTYVLSDETAPEIYRLGTKVFDVAEGMDPMEGAKAAIAAVENFCFNVLGLEKSLTKMGIDDTHFRAMAEHAVGPRGIAGPKRLFVDDVEAILKMCL